VSWVTSPRETCPSMRLLSASIRRIWLCLSVVLLSANACQAADTDAYRYWKEVPRTDSHREEIAAIVLDAEIYAATLPRYADLRIVDEQGAEIPYGLETVADSTRESRRRHAVPSEVVSLREDGNAIEIHLRLPPQHPAVEGLGFVTPLTDYERKVSVRGSGDGVDWQPLLNDGLIFDYRRFMDVGNVDILLPTNSYREFKVLIQQVVDDQESPFLELAKTLHNGHEDQREERVTIERRPFRIDRIDFLHFTTERHTDRFQEVDYPVVGFRVENSPEQKQTYIYVTTRHEPLSALSIQTTSRNFHRRAVVQSRIADSNDPLAWRDLGQGNLTMLDFRETRRETLTIPFPEFRGSEYRIVVNDYDNPPLEIVGAIGKGKVYHAVFLAHPGTSYRVYYGSDSAETPRYDATTVLAAVSGESQPLILTPGDQVPNSTFDRESHWSVTTLLNSRAFFGSAITVMTVVLGWSLYRASRHLDNAANETSGE